MTSDQGPRSFDRPRERPAPSEVSGHWTNGEEARVALTGWTLLVVIKANCDGCRDFLYSDLEEFIGLSVLLVSAVDDLDHEWIDAPRPVLIAPEVLTALDVKWPPFYVLIDTTAGLVRSEGVVFGPAQVAAEIAPYLHG